MVLHRCLSLILFTLFGSGLVISPDRAQAELQEPLLINQIVIDPQNPEVVYAAARPQGVLKSTDRGASWRPARQGLMNTSVYHLAVNPKNSKILYLGTFGGGVYKSENGGEDWFEANNGLGNTNIHALVLNSFKPEQLIVSTSTGDIFKSDDAGKTWKAFNEGLPTFSGEIVATFLVYPKSPGAFYLAQGGLFLRSFSAPAWRAVDGDLQDEVITALAYDSSNRVLYAGTMNRGLFKAAWDSPDVNTDPTAVRAPLNWKPVSDLFQKQSIRLIAMTPERPATLYTSVVNRGLFKSSDGGSSWAAINSGLPSLDVESLAIDPMNEKFLYAGTHNHGIFISRDGGTTWSPPAKVEVEPLNSIIASLVNPPSPNPPKPPLAVPPSFLIKCNKCHGWTDPELNQKATYWRVSPNRREWNSTVRRMSPGAGLTPAEQEEVIRFLTVYGQHRENGTGR